MIVFHHGLNSASHPKHPPQLDDKSQQAGQKVLVQNAAAPEILKKNQE
jgi:hypothetical protein